MKNKNEKNIVKIKQKPIFSAIFSLFEFKALNRSLRIIKMIDYSRKKYGQMI
jgi:hypothetical protein